MLVLFKDLGVRSKQDVTHGVYVVNEILRLPVPASASSFEVDVIKWHQPRSHHLIAPVEPQNMPQRFPNDAPLSKIISRCQKNN